ncbi:unnamed protein product [Urochloa humidicola]
MAAGLTSLTSQAASSPLACTTNQTLLPNTLQIELHPSRRPAKFLADSSVQSSEPERQGQAPARAGAGRARGRHRGHGPPAAVVADSQDVDLDMVDVKVQKLMPELGFALEDADCLVASFSGGWQMRLSLGNILLQDPDLMLPDAPTNHVDLDTIEWLKS